MLTAQGKRKKKPYRYNLNLIRKLKSAKAVLVKGMGLESLVLHGKEREARTCLGGS